MAETPVGIFPDVPPGAEATITPSDNSFVEKSLSRNMREVRRSWGPTTGLRHWAWPTMPLDQITRFRVRQYLKDRQGEFDALYLWLPDTSHYEDAAAGTIAAQSVILIPFRVTNAFGSAIGTLSDIRVAGVTKAFTRIAQLPRPASGGRSATFAALRFTGASTQYVDCGSNTVLRPTGDQSIAAWVFVRSLTADNPIVSTQTLNTSGMSLYVMNTTGKLRFRTNQAGASTFGDSTGAIPINTWTHVAVVRSGTSITFYINGVASGTASSISNPVAATVPFRIGNADSTNYWNGLLNDVRFYDNAISAGEALALYNGTPSPSANLRGYWRLTEGTGTTANDLSGYANTGTMTGAPVWVSGEEEITFPGGAQTGAVTVWGLLRERVVARYDGASRRQRFVGVTPLTSIDLAFQELY